MTSLSPDQTSSTAQTFTSTSPIGRHRPRIVSSVMSVGTFEAFFGHETQSAASCLSLGRIACRRRSRSAFRVENKCTRSLVAVNRAEIFTPSGTGAMSSR